MNKIFLILAIPFLGFGQIVTESCNSMPDPGMCFAAISIYYFDQNTGQCEESIWGGCDGLVPFWTLEDCQNNCENIFTAEIDTTKKIVKVINMLGREMINKGFQLYIYDDGSMEKKYILR